jgi:hypothetical protein
MKGLLSAAAVLGFVSLANATETAYYDLVFFPDNPAATEFAICAYVLNQGAEQPFLEHGKVQGETAGPYGTPSGSYNIVPIQVPGTLPPLAIYMATSRRNATEQYQYFLTGEDNGNFSYTQYGRYMIALSLQPPASKGGKARERSKSGGYTIVDTGSFKIHIRDESCQ